MGGGGLYLIKKGYQDKNALIPSFVFVGCKPFIYIIFSKDSSTLGLLGFIQQRIFFENYWLGYQT